MQENSPLQLLNEIREKAIDLTSQGLSYTRQSTGVKNIAYMINDIHFYCEANEVNEVSVCGNLVSVPQTKSWMRGLVNSKGVLYSVSDLSLLAGFDRPIKTSGAHLLLLNDAASQCALLVSRVIGFRYFNGAQPITDIESKQESLEGLGTYVHEGYEADGHDWFHLDTARLLASEQFREIQ